MTQDVTDQETLLHPLTAMCPCCESQVVLTADGLLEAHRSTPRKRTLCVGSLTSQRPRLISMHEHAVKQTDMLIELIREELAEVDQRRKSLSDRISRMEEELNVRRKEVRRLEKAEAKAAERSSHPF